MSSDDLAEWAQLDDNGYRCNTCLTVIGSVGECTDCPSQEHQDSIKRRKDTP